MYFYYVYSQVSLPGVSGCGLGLSSRAPGSALMWSLLTAKLVVPCQSSSSLSSLLSLLTRCGDTRHFDGHSGETPPGTQLAAITPDIVHNIVGCGHDISETQHYNEENHDRSSNPDNVAHRSLLLGAFNLHGETGSEQMQISCQLNRARSKLSKLDSLASRPQKPQSAAPPPLSKQEREKRTSDNNSINFNIYLNLLLHHRYYCDGGAIIRDQIHAIYIAVN